jgi:hypothetical protein
VPKLTVGKWGKHPLVFIVATLLAQWFLLKLTMFVTFRGPRNYYQDGGWSDFLTACSPFFVGLQAYLVFWPGRMRGRFGAGMLHSALTVPLLFLHQVITGVGSFYFPSAYRGLNFWEWLWRFY